MIENNKQYETTKSSLLRFRKELVLLLNTDYESDLINNLYFNGLKSLVIELTKDIIDYNCKNHIRTTSLKNITISETVTFPKVNRTFR